VTCGTINANYLKISQQDGSRRRKSLLMPYNQINPNLMLFYMSFLPMVNKDEYMSFWSKTQHAAHYSVRIIEFLIFADNLVHGTVFPTMWHCTLLLPPLSWYSQHLGPMAKADVGFLTVTKWSKCSECEIHFTWCKGQWLCFLDSPLNFYCRYHLQLLLSSFFRF